MLDVIPWGFPTNALRILVAKKCSRTDTRTKMATSTGRKTGEAGAITDPDLWKEQQRFYNFLQHYDLHKYHQRFIKMGVLRLTHFKDVTDADLDAVGFTPPEKTRLRKKLDENFSKKGKLKVIERGRKSGKLV